MHESDDFIWSFKVVKAISFQQFQQNQQLKEMTEKCCRRSVAGADRHNLPRLNLIVYLTTHITAGRCPILPQSPRAIPDNLAQSIAD